MSESKHFESGQVIVIMAVVIVVLLGFAALAIDVGMVYSDRRYDQSVADASALSAAQSISTQIKTFAFRGAAQPLCDASGGTYVTGDVINTAKTKAIQRAATNKFTIANNLSSNHGVEILCNHDTRPGYYNTNQYFDITVKITSETSTSFAHLFFGGKLINTVTAQTRVYPRTDHSFGATIVAFKKTCDPQGEIWFAGGGHTTQTGTGITDHITLKGGGTHSNACLTTNGNVVVEVLNGGSNTYVSGTFVPPSSGSVSPPPDKIPDIFDPPPIVTPPCGPKPSGTLPDIKITNNSTETPMPGWYSGVDMTGGDLKLRVGSYCFTGDFKANNGTITGPDTTLTSTQHGNGVTIYMDNGQFLIGGNGGTGSVNISLAANTADITSVWTAKDPIQNLLLYTGPNNSCNETNFSDINVPGTPCISINGGSSQFFLGTILAPAGFIDFGGNPTTTCDTKANIMGYAVKIHGETDLCINYMGAPVFMSPSRMDVTQ